MSDNPLNPFSSIGVCPACNTGLRSGLGNERIGVELSYCEGTHGRGIAWVRSNTRFIDMTTFGDGPKAHLHVTCNTCGYEWLEETASATR